MDNILAEIIIVTVVLLGFISAIATITLLKRGQGKTTTRPTGTRRGSGKSSAKSGSIYRS